MIRAEALRRELVPLIGQAAPLPRLDSALKNAAHHAGAHVVGAMLVTCSDECEHECAESFRRIFAASHLPRLKFGLKTPFRTANLGGRYEWGSVRIAEAHFATDPSRRMGKLMVVKVSGHVGTVRDHARVRYGVLRRYEMESPSCGMLAEVLAGRARDPVGDEIRDLLRSEGVDRLARLQTEVDERLRPLLAAVVSARLHARQALLDAQDAQPITPTTYLVVPAVTLNCAGRDEEVLLGCYVLDRAASHAEGTYQGLGDDPAEITVQESRDRLQLSDPNVHETRPIRDHRELIARAASLDAHGADPRFEEAQRALRAALAARGETPSQVGATPPGRAAAERALLGTAVAILAELAPIPTALVLFGEGLIGISQIWRLKRLAGGAEEVGLARKLVEEARSRVVELDEAREGRLLGRLARLTGLGAHSGAGRSA